MARDALPTPASTTPEPELDAWVDALYDVLLHAEERQPDREMADRLAEALLARRRVGSKAWWVLDTLCGNLVDTMRRYPAVSAIRDAETGETTPPRRRIARMLYVRVAVARGRWDSATLSRAAPPRARSSLIGSRRRRFRCGARSRSPSREPDEPHDRIARATGRFGLVRGGAA
jgi:hypothetical protein